MIRDDYLVRCVGIYHLISSDVPRRYQAIMAARREHACIVLEEQERQKSRNSNCAENLAIVSKASSQESCKQALKIAKLVGLI
jgi:hypothetical protein